jgi:hypothetical protein
LRIILAQENPGVVDLPLDRDLLVASGERDEAEHEAGADSHDPQPLRKKPDHGAPAA